VAAYFAFSTEQQKVDETVVVCDFGAQNFNVTILQQSKGLVSIIGSAEENELGTNHTLLLIYRWLSVRQCHCSVDV